MTYNIYAHVAFERYDNERSTTSEKVGFKGNLDPAKERAIEFSKEYPDTSFEVRYISGDRWGSSKPSGYALNGVWSKEYVKPELSKLTLYQLERFYIPTATWKKLERVANELWLKGYTRRSDTDEIYKLVTDKGTFYRYVGKAITEGEVNELIKMAQAALEARTKWVIPEDAYLGHTWELKTETFRRESLHGVMRQLGSTRDMYIKAAMVAKEPYATALTSAADKLTEAMRLLDDTGA